MRIVQLIDSLEAGGAERMAVNYANTLMENIEFSGLVTTRNEGALKNQLDSRVSYLYLNRRKTFDINAVWKLKKYIQENKIDIIHAHSSSFLIAVLVKLICNVKIIWHDHYGDRFKDTLSNNKFIVLASYLFNGVIACNKELEQWAIKNLNVSEIEYIPNFTETNTIVKPITYLKGESGKRIVCLSNLRNPKNHMALLKSFYESKVSESGWTLHLVGKDYEDDYSKQLSDFITETNNQESVFLYGSCNDVYHVLSQAEIGVLVSTFEGFPLVLLEYGMSALSVITSNVGFCPEIISHNKSGLVFDPSKRSELTFAIAELTSKPELRNEFSLNLNTFVKSHYSKESVIKQVESFYIKVSEND